MHFWVSVGQIEYSDSTPRGWTIFPNSFIYLGVNLLEYQILCNSSSTRPLREQEYQLKKSLNRQPRLELVISQTLFGFMAVIFFQSKLFEAWLRSSLQLFRKDSCWKNKGPRMGIYSHIFLRKLPVRAVLIFYRRCPWQSRPYPPWSCAL